MSVRIHLLIAAFFLALAAVSLAVGDFEYGGRPTQAVFDPGNFLSPQTLDEIAAPLDRIFHDEGVEVIVVVLPDIGDAPPEHVAGRFAAAWCKSPIHAVVLHVPGADGAPWIVPAGKLVNAIRPELLRRKVAEGMRNASREPKEIDKVRAAATEAADMLRYWQRNAINRSQYLEGERTRIRLDLESKALRQRIILLAVAASVIPLLAGVSVLLFVLRRRRPIVFPETRPPRRLGAPYAGGNRAVAELGPLPSQEP